MIFGMMVRNMGPQSSPSVLRGCALAAESEGIDELWLADHIAIPPDDAEGSGGRYLDPLATLAYLAGVTERVRLGVGVLVLPYRPPLVTAKLVATIQELSGNRLILGAGVGWMQAEFQALGVDRRRRGKITDETLTFLHRCFFADEMEANGQKFLFLPRPPRPPIFIGGSPPHALRRAVEYGEGWMPIGLNREALEPAIRELHALADRKGKPRPEVISLATLPLDDEARALETIRSAAEIGVTRIAHAQRYETVEEFAAAARTIAGLARRSA